MRFHPHRHVASILLLIQIGRWKRYRIILNPHIREFVMVDVVVGHKITFSIVYLDQHGNPMLVTPTPNESPAPTWSKLADDSVDAMQVSADRTSAVLTPLSAGVDTVSLSLTVGGRAFNASAQINIAAEPQVLSGIALQAEIE